MRNGYYKRIRLYGKTEIDDDRSALIRLGISVGNNALTKSGEARDRVGSEAPSQLRRGSGATLPRNWKVFILIPSPPILLRATACNGDLRRYLPKLRVAHAYLALEFALHAVR